MASTIVKREKKRPRHKPGPSRQPVRAERLAEDLVVEETAQDVIDTNVKGQYDEDALEQLVGEVL